MNASSWKVARAIIFLHNLYPKHRFTTTPKIFKQYDLKNLVEIMDPQQYLSRVRANHLPIFEKKSIQNMDLVSRLHTDQLFSLIGGNEHDHALLVFRKTPKQAQI